MKNCAIVCEYNPFHSGHKYQLDRVKELGADNIFCVMSGAFVQSAQPAFCDKAIRAECAILGGADAVIELPTVYATASAQLFAEGAVKIIKSIKNVTHMAMGAKADADTVCRLANIKNVHSEKFSALLKSQLNSGKSYNSANAVALTQLYDELYGENHSATTALTDPNSILCIEYLSALNKFGSNIEPLIIPRNGAEYNDRGTEFEHISATAIRDAAELGRLNEVTKFIPFNLDKIIKWRELHTPDINLYKNMAIFSLKRARTEELKYLRDCSEGMEFLFKNMSYMFDHDKYLNIAVGKRYGKKRLQRFFLDIILDIDKTLTDKPFCTRLLACKNGFDFGALPNFVKTNNADIKEVARANSDMASVLKVDIDATALYNTLCRIDGDYFNYSLIKT